MTEQFSNRSKIIFFFVFDVFKDIFDIKDIL